MNKDKGKSKSKENNESKENNKQNVVEETETKPSFLEFIITFRGMGNNSVTKTAEHVYDADVSGFYENYLISFGSSDDEIKTTLLKMKICYDMLYGHIGKIDWTINSSKPAPEAEIKSYTDWWGRGRGRGANDKDKDEYEKKIMKQVGSQVRNKIWEQVRNHVWDQVGEQVRGNVANHILNQVGSQVEEQVRSQVGRQVGEQVKNQVYNQVKNQVGSQVREQIWDQVKNQVEEQVGIQVWDQVFSQVKNQVGRQMRKHLEKKEGLELEK